MTTTDNEVPQEHRHVFELLRAARAGDREAFGELYTLHYEDVFYFLLRRYPSRDAVEDLTADVFVRALQKLNTFTWDPRSTGNPFAAWLVTIARNRLADHFKSGRFRGEILTDRVGEFFDDSAYSHGGYRRAAPAAELAAVSNITSAAVVDALQDLTPLQRDVITLRFLGELSVTETADAMTHEEGAIKTLQYRAVRRLRRDPVLCGLQLADLS